MELMLQKLCTAVMVCVVVVVAGCTTPPKESATVAGAVANEALVRALEQRTSWSLQGSLGISAEKTETTRAQSVSASVRWAEQPSQLDVVLRGPFGIGEMILDANPAQATLRRGRATFVDADPSFLVQRALNLAVPVPLDELSFWMRGLPGTATDLGYDEFGRLKSLSYVDASGVPWQAAIQRYRQLDEVSVPGLITANGGPYKIRLVIRNWRFDPINSDEKPAQNDSGGRLSIPGRSS